MKMDKLDNTIKIYKSSFNPFYFNDILQSDVNDNPNPQYYHETINNWIDIRYAEIKKNEYLKGSINLLKGYLDTLSLLMICTVDLYKTIDRYDGTERAIINSINQDEFEVLELLKAIKDYKISINLNYEKGEDELSIRLSKYCLHKFNECIRNIERQFFIRIYESPIGKKFHAVVKEFKISKNKNRINNNHKETIWFKVGLLFATGEIEELKTRFNNNFTQFAKSKYGERGDSYRVYISESFNRNKSKKNIFNDSNKLNKIYDHCIKEKINMTDNFKSNIYTNR